MRILAAIAMTLTAVSAQSPLTTVFASNNGGSAGGTVMFDLTVTVPTTIHQIDVNSSAGTGTAGTLEVRTCATTFLGNELTPASWTTVSSGDAVTFAGQDQPSICLLASPIVLPPGSHGIMLKADTWAHRYTNGTSPGNGNVYATTELTLNAGSAQNVEYTSPFNPRVANVNLHYTTGGAGFALKAPFGSGCYESRRMIFEEFPSPPTGPIDLINTSWLLIYQPDPNTGGNYIVVPGGPPYDGATAAANGIDLAQQTPSTSVTGTWDDASAHMTLPFSFPFPGPAPGGSTTDIMVNSNGRVALGLTTSNTFANNGANTGFTPTSFAGTTGDGLPMLAAFMCDLDPTAGGNLWYEDPSPGGGVRITWDNIPNWADPAGITPIPNFIQLELLPGGNINLAYGSSIGNGGSVPPTNPNTAIVGFSTGTTTGAAEPLAPPSEVDWSALSGASTGIGTTALSADTDARPVIGTTINTVIDHIPAGSPIAGVLYSLGTANAGTPLDPIGMPGCVDYGSNAVVILAIAPGMTVTSPFGIPNNTGLVGTNIVVQGAAYNPAVISAWPFGNSVGAITSNGVELKLDVN